MHDDQSNERGQYQVLGLVDVAGAIWAARVYILAFIAISVALGLAYLNVATYRYTAELKVAPSDSSPSGGAKSGGLAGLASIAGISLGRDASVTPFQLYLESVKSRGTAEALAKRLDITKVVFESEWDSRQGRFVEQKGLIGSTIKSIKSLIGLPVYSWKAPDAPRMQAFIQETVSVTENPKSPVVTVSFSHKDREFASKFLNVLNQVVDEQLKEKALDKSGRYIAYINRQLNQVTVAEHRQALAQALSEQEKFRMMASSGLGYAAEPLDPASSSDRPTSPQPVVIIFLSATLGFFFGSLFVLAKWWLAVRRASQPGA